MINQVMNGNTSKNVLTSDVEIKGSLKFTGELSFDGKLEGDIQTDGVGEHERPAVLACAGEPRESGPDPWDVERHRRLHCRTLAPADNQRRGGSACDSDSTSRNISSRWMT